MSLSAGARSPMYRRILSRASTSCEVQPSGMVPVTGGADAAGPGLADMSWLAAGDAAALGAGVAAALGAGAAPLGAGLSAGRKVHAAPVVAGPQAARPATAAIPPPVKAAVLRNPRRDNADAAISGTPGVSMVVTGVGR